MKDREVDIVAEAPGRRLALFEMKASATAHGRDFAHMHWFFKDPASAYSGHAFVVYM